MIGIDNSDWHNRFCKRASWYHSGTPKLSCKQCLCIYKAPCLARACWAQPKPVVLHRADAGFAFLQNALSARCKSAQPSRFRDVHRDWDCIPTSRIRTANLQCHACLSLCIYRGTACWSNPQSKTCFLWKEEILKLATIITLFRQ